MIQDFFSKQFILFLLTSGTAAAANFGSRWVYNHWMDFSIAIIPAYLTGMVTAFVLAKLFVFKESKQQVSRSIWIFSLVNFAALVQTWAVSLILAFYLLPWLQVTHYIHEIAHGIGVMVPAFTSYLGHKRWTFKA